MTFDNGNSLLYKTQNLKQDKSIVMQNVANRIYIASDVYYSSDIRSVIQHNCNVYQNQAFPTGPP